MLNYSSFMKNKITFLFLLFFVASLNGQDKTYTAVRWSGEKISLDGEITENSWNAAEWDTGFIQLTPYENRPPSQPTNFKILYDNNFIYVAIKAFDSSPDSIVRRMSRRDDDEGDLVGIAFDTYHDKRTAFVFEVNAAGVKIDAVVTEDGNNWDYDWDPIWYVKTTIDSNGWTAEMKIPITQLRFGKQSEYVWGLQVGRHFFRKGEDSGWKLISPNAPGWVSFFGELHGIRGISPKKQNDIIPYMVAELERYEKSDENPFETGKGSRMSGGLDGKIGITNDFTLDFTINPDFGQVEADPSVVNLTAFETYYEEKRLFFIEGRNIVNFNMTQGGPLSTDNLLYSRRIGRPPQLYPDIDDNEYVKMPLNTTIIAAGRLTGKTRNGWSVGLLEAVTQREDAVIDSGGRRRSEPVEPLTNYVLGRVQKDFNKGNTRIGGMFTATNRRLDEPVLLELRKSAYTGGIDVNHQWKNKTYYINFKTLFSYVSGTKEAILATQTSAPRYFQRPDAPHLHVDSSLTSLTGFGGTITGGRAGNSKWPFLIWVTWRSPSLELNDMGYLYTPDIIQEVFWVGYHNYEPFSIFRNFFVNFNQWYASTFGWEKIYMGGNANINARFKNYWFASIGAEANTTSRSNTDLRGGPALLSEPSFNAFINISTNNRKKLIFTLGGNDYFGLRHEFSIVNCYGDIDWRVSKALKISLTPSVMFNNQQLAYVNNVEDSLFAIHYIRGKMKQVETSLTIRLTYNITPDFTIQYYGMPFVSAGDYDHFSRIANPSSRNLYERFDEFSNLQISQYIEDDKIKYAVDANIDGRPDFWFDNPDFNRFEYRSNLVARWEYLPGSTAYLVWSFSQFRYHNNGDYSFSRDMGEIFRVHPHMIFLFKISYRIGL
jgi:hypothetical protein